MTAITAMKLYCPACNALLPSPAGAGVAQIVQCGRCERFWWLDPRQPEGGGSGNSAPRLVQLSPLAVHLLGHLMSGDEGEG